MANLLNDRLKQLNGESDEKKNKSQNKKVKEKTVIQPAPSKDLKIEESDYDKQIDVIADEEHIENEKKQKLSKHKYYFVKIFLCFLCGYLIFLIYGVAVTTYDYDEDGTVRAQVMSKDDIKHQKEYTTLLGYYMDARTLYEKILLLNYELDHNEDDALSLVPKYEALLDESNRIITQIKAVTPSKEYSQAYTLLLNWIDADLSSYLQEISAGISQSNEEHWQNAINDKQRCYNDCYQLTANMISLGENIKGVNISGLKEWSPEQFIKDEMGDV